MMVKAVWSTVGLSEWMEKIQKTGESVDDAAERSVLAGAEVAQEEMIDRAPELTGNLKKHIKIKGPKRDGNEVSAEVGVIHDIKYTDAETARYAMAQEYGTSSMPANPYIRPAWKKGMRKIRKAQRESLKKDAIL
jgi:HK97 gp10 family phage protein